MRKIRVTRLAAVVLAAVASGHAAPASFEGATWIWFSLEPMPLVQDFPAGACQFRAAVDLPPPDRVASAELLVGADNLYVVHLNGRPAGEGPTDPNQWSQPRRFDVAPLLVAGRNVLAVEAVNTADGPAGLIVKLVVRDRDGRETVLASDGAWRSTNADPPGWRAPGYDDKAWSAPHVVGDYGIPPWGAIAPPAESLPAGESPARESARAALAAQKAGARRAGAGRLTPVKELEPPADYAWPAAVLYVADDCSLYRPPQHTGTSADSLNVTIFNPRHARTFPEHDLPAPMKVGRRLAVLRPARPGVTPATLHDAGQGALGSPSVTFDGTSVLFSMAREGDAFFHLYRIAARGGAPVQLTDGPFHDIDPVELPDGRIVFTSTRIGTFEEYHNPPSRALFALDAGGGIRPLTHTFIFDNEPEVLADGRLLFIRSDNFFDRGKVETTLHAFRPDGTGGYTEFGLDLGPEYGGRLRAFDCGSPAPMPDGRVAYVSATGIDLGRPGAPPDGMRRLRLDAGDVAALPDGRLLCTLARRTSAERVVKKQRKYVVDFSYEKLALLDPDDPRGGAVILLDTPDEPLHSPVFLGPRPRPVALADKVDPRAAEDPRATGVLFCQDARFTRNTSAGWDHVRAVRVLAGAGLTLRSSHSYLVHAGSEVTDLGTVPLAPDGSFAVEVPADTAIAFQMVDGEGRSELNQMSWIYVRPGEQRGCVGCHQPRQSTPPLAVGRIQALRARPVRLTGQGDPLRFRGNNAAVTGLMELQFDRYREMAGLNRHDGAPEATGAQEVAALIAQLGGGDAGRMISAANRLAVFRACEAVPALAGALRHEAREVRLASAMALAACGTRDAAAPLLAALGDADPVVAQAAAVALENLTGHREPVDGFAPREGRDAAWRSWLATNAWDAIQAGLAAAVAGGDRDAARRAAVALGHVGAGEAARAALREALARGREVNPYPAWRQHNRGDGAKFNAASPANPRALQAVARALGSLDDAGATALLAETLAQHADPATGNLFLAEACAEALGALGTPESAAALAGAFPTLKPYWAHAEWYGDHGALIACHASPIHYLITEALDAAGAPVPADLVPFLIRSVPTDPDRALLPGNDDGETLVGRAIRRAGAEARVTEACLAVLGDAAAARSAEVEAALAVVHGAWAGTPGPENRAAQILSLTCRDRRFEPRIRAAFARYREKPVTIPRVFDTGIPVVNELPVRHWVCFYLARALGNLADPASAEALVATLEQSPPESAAGYPDPLGPGVLFLHNDLTPCWRAEVAWALGRIGDRRAGPALVGIVKDLANAPDTRHAAAVALGRLRDPALAPELARLARACPDVATRRALLAAAP